jgi:hypothetical protein
VPASPAPIVDTLERSRAMSSHGPATVSHLENQTLVTIAIKNNKLSVYPKRAGEVRAYYRKKDYHPELPTEIRWVVTGLESGQSIRIEAKDSQPHLFPAPFVITHPENTVCSQSPSNGPSSPHSALTWSYAVKLLQGTTILDTLDPDVEIKDNP